MSEPVNIMNSTATKTDSLMKQWLPIAGGPIGYMTGDVLGISGFADALLVKYSDMEQSAIDQLSTIVVAVSYIGIFLAFWRTGTFGKVIAWFALGIAFNLFMTLKGGVVA